MKTRKKALPEFRNARDFARFVETHDLADYWDEFEEVPEQAILDSEVAQRIERRTGARKLISIRLDEWQIRLAKATAAREGVPYHAVIRRWIDYGVKGGQRDRP